MNTTKCFHCGSSNLKADRALAGRLICANCGNLYIRRNNINLVSLPIKVIPKKLYLVVIAIITIIIIIITSN